MIKITLIALILLLVALITPAYGYAELANLTDTTTSDKDIILSQHLIELDTVLLDNNLTLKETLVFKNTGEQNFSGSLSIWVPDDAVNTVVAKVEMMTESTPISLPATLKKVQNGNIISWSSSIQKNSSLPPMYIVVYQVPGKEYSKIFLYPTETKQPTNSIVLKLTLNKGETASITDGSGNRITTSASIKEDPDANSILYGWDAPQFTEVKVEITKPPIVAPSGFDNLGIYFALGILILAVLSYPFLRTKSTGLQEFEDRLKKSFKKVEQEKEEIKAVPPSEKIAGSNEEIGSLEKEKSELLSKLAALDKKYASGDLMDEEYDELREPYKKRLKEIEKLIGT